MKQELQYSSNMWLFNIIIIIIKIFKEALATHCPL